MKQHFWAGGAYLGQREIPDIRLGDPNGAARGLHLDHFNTAYFCPYCGDIWGRVTFDEANPRWQITSRACREHSITGLEQAFGGCLQSTFPGADPCRFAADWPVEAIRWEAETLLMKQREFIECRL